MDDIRIHKTAIIDKKAVIGEGTSVWQYSIIQEDVKVGCNCNIGANVFLENGVRVGNGVKIKNNISIYNGVTIKDDAFLGPNCVFTNVINPRSFISRKNEFQQTVVEEGAAVGANATIVCGNTIGKYSMIGAGSVVTMNIPDYALAFGNPAKIKGYVCKCGYKLDNMYKCSKCRKEYEMKGNKMILRIQGVLDNP